MQFYLMDTSKMETSRRLSESSTIGLSYADIPFSFSVEFAEEAVNNLCIGIKYRAAMQEEVIPTSSNKVPVILYLGKHSKRLLGILHNRFCNSPTPYRNNPRVVVADLEAALDDLCQKDNYIGQEMNYNAVKAGLGLDQPGLPVWLNDFL